MPELLLLLIGLTALNYIPFSGICQGLSENLYSGAAFDTISVQMHPSPLLRGDFPHVILENKMEGYRYGGETRPAVV
jgi:hypothetical protein